MIYVVDGNLPVDSIIHRSNNWGSHVTRRNYKNGCTSITGGKIRSLNAGLDAG